jgi:AraC family transcriptional regulator, arabinose operon regulatory protein
VHASPARLLRDGFPGQRLRVLPSPLIGEALASGPTSRMLVTDAGYFPHATNHGRRRTAGSTAAVVIVSTAGVGWCQVGRRTTPVHRGQALVIPPGVPHLYWAEPDDPWTIWWVHTAGEDVPHLLGVVTDGTEAVIGVRDVPRAVAHVDRAVSALERDETLPSLLEAAAAGWALLAQLAGDRVSGVANGGRTDPVHDAQEHLRSHLQDPISVPAMARRAGLSTSHFAARFRAVTGTGVVEYSKRLRMARARELLISTRWSVAEIATAVGYADPFYFARHFRAVNGCSPTAFRRQSDREGVHDWPVT